MFPLSIWFPSLSNTFNSEKSISTASEYLVIICVVPIGAFVACDGSESSRNGCAYTDGIPISKIKNVKNAWIQLDNSLGINGLYSVKIQVIDSLDEKTIFETIESVKKLLMENRSLCSDFSDIKVLKKEMT